MPDHGDWLDEDQIRSLNEGICPFCQGEAETFKEFEDISILRCVPCGWAYVGTDEAPLSNGTA